MSVFISISLAMAIEAKLNLNPDPDSAVQEDLPSWIATTTILFSLSLLLHVCHRYDFLVCLYWNGLTFFELFKLLFFTRD